MTMADPRAQKAADEAFNAITGWVGRSLLPMAEKIAALEKRLAELEARPVPDYRGVFKHGETYSAGSMVTHSGSLWYAVSETKAKPGTGPGSGWVLAVKSGSLPRRDD
jgi:hypothetical protein